MKVKNPLFLLTTLLLLCSIDSQGQKSVKTHESVKIGEIHQWIGAAGEDASKPVLLFLHGGPGFSSRGYSKKFIKHLKKDFIVVQWDQRETGITAHWGAFTDSLHVDILHRDTEEVVDYVLKKFSKEKLYLVGFSWGGYLGLNYARLYPERLHAYISVSSMIHGDESEKRTLGLLQEKVKGQSNEEANHQISEITVPFKSWKELYYQRKWTAELLGDKASSRTYPSRLFQEWSAKWMPVFLEASRTDYTIVAPEILCPIYFFISNRDYVSNYTVAENYFNELEAEHKRLVWFEESSHEIPNQESKKFSEELIKIPKELE